MDEEGEGEDGLEDEGCTGTTSAKAVATLRANLVDIPLHPPPLHSHTQTCTSTHRLFALPDVFYHTHH